MSTPNPVESFLAQAREQAKRALLTIDKAEAILCRVPEALLQKCVFFNEQIDFDHLTRPEVEQMITSARFGRWEKKLNGTHPDLMDYETIVDGIRIRLWAAGPPETCRIVEVEEVVPEQRIIKRKLICTPEPIP